MIVTMSGLHHWGDWIYFSVLVALIMLWLIYEIMICDLWFTKVCVSGYQDQCGIMMLLHDYPEMCAKIVLCIINVLH